MKMIIYIEDGLKLVLDCETTTIERVKYLTSIHEVKDIQYINN